MASSDDEGEAMPRTVSNYYFVDNEDEPISFSELPIQWNDGEGIDCQRKHIFLHGTTDNGLQKIHKQVVAWKFNLSNMEPEIAVLSKENNWINLQKPRKSYESTIRTILITVHCLHLVKKNPENPAKSVWDNLSKVFSSYEARPSQNDLIDHTTFIREAVKRDETLLNSKFLVTFLEEKPRKKKALDEDMGTSTQAGFIVDDYMTDEIEEEDGSDEEVDLFDSVCAICDNGGVLLCCEGRCMRSFHATVKAGSESMCESLGFSDEQVKAMPNFFCKNCQYKQHQCFSCGELGSSDKLSGAEVFPCVSATCGRFYHPHCVAKLLHPDNGAEAEELQKKIAAGDSFTCPIHKCFLCKQGEDKMDTDLQFAVCRRCPKSYHRKCLPRKIAFEDEEDEGIIQRAWEDLIPNRILIYCLKHVIDDELATPIRNHIKFPDDQQRKKKQASQQLSSEEKILERERNFASEDAPRERTLGKGQKGVALSAIIKEGDSSKKRVGTSNELDFSKKQKVAETSTKPLKGTTSTKVSKLTTNVTRPSLGERLFCKINKDPESVKSGNEDMPASEPNQTLTLEDDAKRRILTLMKEATSSSTLEEIIKKHRLPSTHCVSSRHVVDKTMTLGKVEGSVEALRAALKKLEGGCSMEDAKAVCEPGLLHQMVRWKNKLRVYLAPFLFGMRYTSFGRHFTKVDKLKQIVDRLHCYVQDGDMIVDFCCGANDFSWLMKKKIDETGKKCSYKNYDVLPAKNDFNFEKRDWMRVKPKELPAGSQLIMGLNPPFGVNATLANQFIDKALEFKPKLLILIVPRETERLDKKRTPYDLIWEDNELLAGKSFYLPGSVDVNDNQLEDWNVTAPPLYLWSRSDWTTKHKAIAQQHGHFPGVQKRPHLEEHSVENESVHEQKFQERGASVSESHKERFPVDNGKRKIHQNDSHEKNQSNESSKKKRRGAKRNRVRELGEASKKGEEKGRSSSRPMELREGGDQHSNLQSGYVPAYSADDIAMSKENGRSSSRPMELREGGDRHSHLQTGYVPAYSADDIALSEENGRSSSRLMELREAGDRHSHLQTGYVPAYSADDIAMKYLPNNKGPYSGFTHGLSIGADPGPVYGVRHSDGLFGLYQRESAIRSEHRPYVEQNPDAFNLRSSSFLGGQHHHIGVSDSYSHPRLGSSAVDPSYNRTNTSAMDRYAPRLDELNHPRVNNLGYETPMAGRSGIPDPRASQHSYRFDPQTFAPGSYRSYSQQNSAGWVDD